MNFGWADAKESLPGKEWKCGHCGNIVAGTTGYSKAESSGYKRIYICPKCNKPTYFEETPVACFHGYDYIRCQIPNSPYGNEVEFIPEIIADLYKEIRKCIQYGAYTSAVLSMRKLLMHIAVEHGADDDLSFAKYVDYLEESHWIPPNGREWVDSIRKKGNEATHEIVLMSEHDAKQLFDFIEMLLKFMYEFPGKHDESKND